MNLKSLSVSVLLAASLHLRAGFTEDWDRLQQIVPAGYQAPRAKNPISIDGRIDEPGWAAAPWTRDFQDIEGSAKPAPRFRTRAKMLWDDEFFYIAAELQEPHIWGVLTNHDAVIFQDPDFELFIDPDGDRHNYYEFELNALNTGWDLILKKPYIDGGPALNQWEIPGLKTAVHLRGTLNQPNDRDEGWTLEIALPWKVLSEFSKQSAPPRSGDVWRVNFSRVEWQIEIKDGKYGKTPGKKEDNWVWSPMGIVDMHRPENWGFVKFVETPDDRPFRPARDSDRDALLSVYYLQKEYRARKNDWAASLPELLSALNSKTDLSRVKLEKTRTGYHATVGAQHIRDDGLLWSDH